MSLRPRLSWRDALIDLLPAILLLVLGELDIAFGLSVPIGSAPAISAVVPVLVATGALVLRRRRPRLTLVIVVGAVALPPLILPTSLTYWGELVPLLVALYSVARHLKRRQAFAGIGIVAAGFALMALALPGFRSPAELIYDGVLVVAAWLLGLFSRSWASYRDRTLRLEFERAEAEERAGREERARIARELHDVISHTITVIVMQAGGARIAQSADPGAATRALAEIESLGRGSLAELRMLLSVLGSEDEQRGSAAPQPTLADVGELCDRMRSLGLPVTLMASPLPEDLPLGVQLSAYRVVQEGLTNVMKHSGPVPTSVRIERRTGPGLLLIEVASRPPADALQLVGSGRGLAGLDERVQAMAGTMTAGTQPDGGFLLRVELPLGREVM